MLLIDLIEIFGVNWLDLASENMVEDDENDVGWLGRFLRFGGMIEFVDLVYVCLYTYKSQLPKWSEIIDDIFLIIYGY